MSIDIYLLALAIYNYCLRSEIHNAGTQVNIQNELSSSATQTRSRKSREVQTEQNNAPVELEAGSADAHRLKRIIDKRSHLIEDAIMENNESTAFQSVLIFY